MTSEKPKQNILMKPIWHLGGTFILSVFVLITIISVNLLFTDRIPLVTGDGSFLSNVGIILWCVSATVCLFASMLIVDNKLPQARHFLMCSGLLTAYLLFDDFFELHERYFPMFFNIDEKIIYIILGIATSTIIIKYRQLILRTHYIVMLMSLGFLAISIASDGILNPIEIVYGMLVLVVLSIIYMYVLHRYLFKEYLLMVFLMSIGLCIAYITLQSNAEYSEYIFEESAKWIGIASWCSYYVHTAYQLVIDSYSNQ